MKQPGKSLGEEEQKEWLSAEPEFRHKWVRAPKIKKDSRPLIPSLHSDTFLFGKLTSEDHWLHCCSQPDLMFLFYLFFLKQLSKAVAFPFWKKCLFCFMTSSVMVLPKQPASLRYNVLNEELPACRSDPAQSCRMAPQLSHRKEWGGGEERVFLCFFFCCCLGIPCWDCTGTVSHSLREAGSEHWLFTDQVLVPIAEVLHWPLQPKLIPLTSVTSEHH